MSSHLCLFFKGSDVLIMAEHITAIIFFFFFFSPHRDCFTVSFAGADFKWQAAMVGRFTAKMRGRGGGREGGLAGAWCSTALCSVR